MGEDGGLAMPEMEDLGGERHILVVDDEPHIGRIIQMKLERGPYRVTLASDGRQAHDLHRGEQRIDLVLLDIMMPYVSGFDVLQEIRTVPHRESTPVIMLTAKGQPTAGFFAGLAIGIALVVLVWLADRMRGN